MRIFIIFYFLISTPIFIAQDTIQVYFQNNSAFIGKINKQVIKNHFKQNSSTKIIEIIGYTDINGTKKQNLELSKKRNESTIDLLKKINGVNLNKSKIINHGEVKNASKRYYKDRTVKIIYKATQSIRAKIKNAKKGDKIELKNMNFIGGSPILLKESKPILVELLKLMENNPNLKIKIEGHICCSLIDDQNLSENRAKTVYSYLLENNISENRMSYEGYSSKYPKHALPEKNESERTANRRVEIRIIDK
ncbi:MAG: OmpA family protein [Crocinitomicaceae bacterium]|nr:OmpA family protein [Crocinitomicaceae bacterium]